jgi:hypothetical protein
MKSTTLLLSVAALTAGMILSEGTRAEDWKPVGEWSGQIVGVGKGKPTQLEKGHIYNYSEGIGTFVSDKGKGGLFDKAGIKCVGDADIDTNKRKATFSGVCVVNDASGAQAYLKYQGEGDTVTWPGTFEWSGGTGKYQSISGSNGFVTYVTTIWPDGTSSSYTTWNR